MGLRFRPLGLLLRPVGLRFRAVGLSRVVLLKTGQVCYEAGLKLKRNVFCCFLLHMAIAKTDNRSSNNIKKKRHRNVTKVK